MKISVHKLICPRCNKEYEVKTPAYKRKLKDDRYGMLCQSCRAKVLWEEMDKEKKTLMHKKSLEVRKNRIKNMSIKARKEYTNKRSKIAKKYWNSLSDEERKCISKQRSINQKNYQNSLSDEERKEIRRKISSTKINNNQRMSEKDRMKRKLQKQKERKHYWNSLSPEERDIIRTRLRNNGVDYWESVSDDEKKRIINKLQSDRDNWRKNINESNKVKLSKKLSSSQKKYRNSLSTERRKELSVINSKSQKKRWESYSAEELKKISDTHKSVWLRRPEDEKERIVSNMHDGFRNWYDSLSDEEKIDRGKRHSEWWNSLSDKEYESMKQMNVDRWEKYTDKQKEEIKHKISLSNHNRYESLSDSEKENVIKPLIDYRNSLSGDALIKFNNKLNEWRSSLSAEEWQKEVEKQHKWLSVLDDNGRIELNNKTSKSWKLMDADRRKDIIRRMLSHSNGKNSLHKRFESAFEKYGLGKYFYYVPEHVTSYDNIFKSWDYAIFDVDRNLQMVIDLDGAYYHADICDYDGIHSRIYYDTRRYLLIPDNIKHMIIYELEFDKSFELMTKLLQISYVDYITYRIDVIRYMPFPQPQYTDRELISSYKQLERLNCNDKYHKDLSIKNREGDRIIHHFHDTLFDYLRCNWDEYFISKNVMNNKIYHTHINRNKLLQTLIPEFTSAGKYKMLIDKYCKSNTVYDPDVKIGTTMLAAISLGKKFIGICREERIVNELNRIINFLKNHGIEFNISLYSNMENINGDWFNIDDLTKSYNPYFQ